MTRATWVYRKADNVFLRGGFSSMPYDPATEGAVEFGDSELPDRRLHRYDGVGGKRLATAEELAAYDTATEDTRIAGELNESKLIRAVAFVLLARILGRTPTAQERLQFAADVKAVYKSL